MSIARDLDVVHTLNARGHIYLEVVRDYFGLDSTVMYHQIRSLRSDVERDLKSRGVLYQELRGALTPNERRREIAFVFDAFELQDTTWYGLPVFRRYMPLFDKRSSHSVLAGDFLGENNQQDHLYEVFCDAIYPAKHITWRHSSLFYIIYINNMSDAMVERFHSGLFYYNAYVGFADCTYESKFKLHMSLKLCNIFVKHKSIIIQGNPDDGADADYGREDYNSSGYPFDEFGYKCKSINDILFGTMLSFKIERPVFRGFETDTEFGLNTIMSDPASLKEFTVSVNEAKLTYLKSQKGGSLERARLENVSTEELAALINKKINQSYIYEMKVKEGARLFNVIIEVGSPNRSKTRLRCGIRYEAETRKLELVTMF